MRILHIITRLIVGGAQENTLLTCEGLHARGHEVILLVGPSPGPEGSLMARARTGGYEVIVTPHLVRSPHPSHDWQAYREIKGLCRDLAPDVVHTHSSKAGIVGRAAAWRARWEPRKPLVMHTIHGLPFHPYQNALARAAWIRLERYAARRCHAIITVADAMARQAMAAKVVDPQLFTTWTARDIKLGSKAVRFKQPELLTTIYSGMEIEPFLHPPTTPALARASLGIPKDRLVFATIARLQPLKGHDDLLEVAGSVFKEVPKAHFLWIGDGIFRARLEHLIRQNGWEDHFTLTGLVPPEQVAMILPAADVVVHPSYREGLARALPQGLLAGKAVISYDCDGAGEVCVDGQTGRLVPTGSAGGLGAALVWMAQHEEERIQMGQRGRELCMGRFPASVMVDQIEKLYLALQSKSS